MRNFSRDYSRVVHFITSLLCSLKLTKTNTARRYIWVELKLLLNAKISGSIRCSCSCSGTPERLTAGLTRGTVRETDRKGFHALLDRELVDDLAISFNDGVNSNDEFTCMPVAFSGNSRSQVFCNSKTSASSPVYTRTFEKSYRISPTIS